ncbi:DUF3786 domain-containing protein [Desulfobacterales bacterium HSG17]|nr:DUF3786 domain-containing protein [Desulfobacterales bacterium HSG17]
MMSKKSIVFEKIYKNYLSQIAVLDTRSLKEALFIQTDGNKAIIPFFGKPYRISSEGVSDFSGNKPDHSVCIILFKYLLLCPQVEPRGESEWVAYRDFKDAAPFVGGFATNTEKAIAKNFSGRLDTLKSVCTSLAGNASDIDATYDFVMQFSALPKVPLLLLFNDADEGFPAQCKVLFERRAAKYLDMECLAMAGMLLSLYLKKSGLIQPYESGDNSDAHPSTL